MQHKFYLRDRSTTAESKNNFKMGSFRVVNKFEELDSKQNISHFLDKIGKEKCSEKMLFQRKKASSNLNRILNKKMRQTFLKKKSFMFTSDCFKIFDTNLERNGREIDIFGDQVVKTILDFGKILSIN